MRMDQPDAAQDWWTANAPPPDAMPAGPVTDPTDPRLSNPAYASDPDVLTFLNGIYGPNGTVYNPPAADAAWNPESQAWNPEPSASTAPAASSAASSVGNTPAVPGSTALPGAPDNFGAAPPAFTPAVYTPPAPYVPSVYTPPAPYVPPTWEGGPPPTAPTLTRYTPPTQAELEASPGFLSREAAGNRGYNMSAAAKGTVLNGGTQKGLARYNQDYASNEYGNLVAQGQATTSLNNNATQTEFGDAFSNYQARYGQFTDAAAMGKTAYDTNYGISKNAFDTNEGNASSAYTTNAALGKNAFDTNEGNAFSAFTTNTANKRNAETDYWTRLNDLYNTGANVAAGSYKAP